MRKPFWSLSFVLLLAACEEEAIVNPPPPPSTPVRELGSAPPRNEPASLAVAASKPAVATTKMTLEDFMDDVIEPQMKKQAKTKKRDPALDALLLQLGPLMPPELPGAAKKPWSTIVNGALLPVGTAVAPVPKYGAACKSCHALYKKPYKKTFHKRELDVVLPPPDAGK